MSIIYYFAATFYDVNSSIQYIHIEKATSTKTDFQCNKTVLRNNIEINLNINTECNYYETIKVIFSFIIPVGIDTYVMFQRRKTTGA